MVNDVSLRIGIDVGGTFTDFVLADAAGEDLVDLPLVHENNLEYLPCSHLRLAPAHYC